jgi:hypothetical protein
MDSMYCSFYLRRGTAFVPTTARTEAGYWMAIEPVDVRKVESPEALQSMLLAAIKRGNPVVPTPTRDNFPRPVMERYCGLKSLSAFERTASCWAISQHDGEFYVYEWRRSERYRGAREKADETEVSLPGGTPIDMVAMRAAEIAMTSTEQP